MSSSVLYTANANAQTISVGGLVNLGSVVRRYGCNCKLSNANTVTVDGQGYYNVDGTFVLAGTGTSASTTTISLYKDGVAIPGAVASVSLASGDVATIGINAIVRETGCCPCNNSSDLTFVVSGSGATVNNSSVVVEKM